MNTEPEQNQPAIAANPTPNLEFRIGGVLSKTFGVFFRNFVPFVLMAALILAPFYALQYYLLLDKLDQVVVEWNWVDFAVGIAQILAGYLVTATLIYGSIQELRGTRSNIIDCFQRGLPLLLPVVGVSIVAFVVVMIGTLLLVIPGIIATIVLAVVVPVAVVERPGIFASLGRSRELTKGHRWQVLALFIVLFVISSAAGFVVALVFGLATDSTASVEVQFIQDMLPNLIIGPVTTAFYAVMMAVIYHDLRISKEGDDTETIARVFD